MIVNKAKEIKRLLAKNEIQLAFHQLNELLDEMENKKILKSFIINNASYNRLKEAKMDGTISFSEETLESSRIIAAIVEIVDLIIENYAVRKENKKSFKNKLLYILIISLLSNLGLLFLLYNNSYRQSNNISDCIYETKIEWFSLNAKLETLGSLHLFNGRDQEFIKSIKDKAIQLNGEYKLIVNKINDANCINPLESPFLGADVVRIRNILSDIVDDKSMKIKYVKESLVWNDYSRKLLNRVNDYLEKDKLDKSIKYKHDEIEGQNISEFLKLERIISLGILYLEGDNTVLNDIKITFAKVKDDYIDLNEKMISNHPIIKELVNLKIIEL